MSEQASEFKSTVTLSSYNDKPVIVLGANSKWPFSFGVGKAKMILQHLDSIKKFVESDGEKIK